VGGAVPAGSNLVAMSLHALPPQRLLPLLVALLPLCRCADLQGIPLNRQSADTERTVQSQRGVLGAKSGVSAPAGLNGTVMPAAAQWKDHRMPTRSWPEVLRANASVVGGSVALVVILLLVGTAVGLCFKKHSRQARKFSQLSAEPLSPAARRWSWPVVGQSRRATSGAVGQFHMICPLGLEAGQPLRAKAPDGRVFTVQVPGVLPGQQFLVVPPGTRPIAQV